MKKFSVLIIACLLLFSVSCGGSGDEKDCPAGYKWDGTECVPDSTVTQPDDDPIIDDRDKNGFPDEENDEDTDEDIDEDTDPYTGECTPVKAGGNLDIDVVTHTVTIGDVTINGTSNDSLLYGNLWGRNTATLSEFKLSEINGDLPGKKYDFPKGTYDFFFRVSDFDNIVNIRENVNVSTDLTVDLDIPLYHLTGSVKRNGSTFTVDEEFEDVTEITIRSGSYEFAIPYSDFSGFDILVPAGKYSVYFKGQLATGRPAFEGTVLGSDNGIEVDDDTAYDINIQTAVYSGTVENGQNTYEVNTGQLILAENPPMGAKTTVVIEDLAEKNFSVTVIKGNSYSLLYLPEADTYPTRYIGLETWSDTNNPNTNGNKVTLYFSRLYGTVSFLGGGNLPTVENCTGAGCSRGKLKLIGFDMSSYLIKDFGVEGADLSYDALVVRSTPTVVPDPDGGEGATKTVHNPRNYYMVFESHLNDIEGVFNHIPFEVKLRYLNNENNLVSNFNFQNVDETFSPERSINFNISPFLVEGTIKIDGNAFETDEPDYIVVKNEMGMEIPVVKISDTSNGLYSFFIPEGDYDIIYHGTGALNSEFKTNIEQNITISSNLPSLDLNLTTVRLFARFEVNGMEFADWAGDTKSVDSYAFLINPDKTAATYYLDVNFPETGVPYAKVLAGSTLNIYLEAYIKNDSAGNRNLLRMPMLLGQQILSDTNLDMPLSLVPFTTSITLNGKAVTGATDFVAALRIPGQNRTEIYYPPDGDNKTDALLKKGEHRTPRPEIMLNDGFNTKQSIQTNCIYVY